MKVTTIVLLAAALGVAAAHLPATQGDTDPAMDHSVAFSGEAEDEASE